MTGAHAILVADSPIFKSRPKAQQSLILDLIEVLSDAPAGLPPDRIRRTLSTTRRADSDSSGKELERTLEGCGLFRVAADGRFHLSDLAVLETPLTARPIVAMDLEATGGRPPLHRLIEVAVIRRGPDGTTHSFSSLANPRRPLPWYVSKMTGLTSRQIREAPAIDRVMDQLLPYLDGALLVFHGSNFDLELLNYELFRRRQELISNPAICTIALTREFEPDLTTMGLDRVAGHLGIPVKNQHRAGDDALLTLALYDRFVERFAGAGIEYLVDLAFFQGRVPVPPFLKTNLSVELLADLPQTAAAFVMWDEKRHVLVATSSADLRRDLSSLFFPDRVLDPERKALARSARYLEYLVLSDPAQAQEAIEELLERGPRRSSRPVRSS